MAIARVRFQTVTTGKQIFDAEKVLRAVQQTQNLYAGQIVNRGQQYPAERPNQKYKRSKLAKFIRNSWKVTPSHISGDRMTVEVRNDARDKRKQYASYVFGTNDEGSGQSFYHTGRWSTIGQLANRGSYRQQVQNAVNKAVGK